MEKVPLESLQKLFEELIEMHKSKLLESGRRIVPNLTQEDVLQPNDFPELEFHPYFRYEEGILDGIRMTQMALLALIEDLSKEKTNPSCPDDLCEQVFLSESHKS